VEYLYETKKGAGPGSGSRDGAARGRVEEQPWNGVITDEETVPAWTCACLSFAFSGADTGWTTGEWCNMAIEAGTESREVLYR
jgi:hypothetical protein